MIYYKKKQLIIYSALSLSLISLYFSLVGFRSYYIAFLAPFIVIPIALLVNFLWSKRKILNYLIIVLLITVFVKAGLYSYNTHIKNDYMITREWCDSGRSGDYKIPPICLTCNFSRTTRYWVEDWD